MRGSPHSESTRSQIILSQDRRKKCTCHSRVAVETKKETTQRNCCTTRVRAWKWICLMSFSARMNFEAAAYYIYHGNWRHGGVVCRTAAGRLGWPQIATHSRQVTYDPRREMWTGTAGRQTRAAFNLRSTRSRQKKQEYEKNYLFWCGVVVARVEKTAVVKSCEDRAAHAAPLRSLCLH